MRLLSGFVLALGSLSSLALAQPVCGNGTLEGDELCERDPRGGYFFIVSGIDCGDFGFTFGTLGCDASCQYSTANCRDEGYQQFCGNREVERGEECDGGAHCSATCQCVDAVPARCGNGCVERGEQCDDGDPIRPWAGDICDGATCQFVSLCGDGFHDLGEECDEGGANSDSMPDQCRTSCALPTCGDYVVDTGEQCDEGARNSDTIADRCRESCRLPRCGDSVVDTRAGEECDLGAANADTPSSRCNLVCLRPGCGNGYVEPWETCDDGNQRGGDGCSALCDSLEVCGNRIVDVAAGESCDDGNRVDGDGCNASCRLESCGNGTLDAGEVCDDGNTTSGDGCSASCASDERCGNTIVDSAAGETCDDGNTTSGDGCRSDCTLERCGDGRLDALESCDDEGVEPGDGCDELCRVEEGYACEGEPSVCALRPVDAGVDAGGEDAGVDAGPADAGRDAATALDAGADAGEDVEAKGGCGCATENARGSWLAVGLALFALRRRRVLR